MSKFTEKEILSEAVVAIDEYGSLNTSELIEILRNKMQPDGHDVQIIKDRNDDYFSQKVRNLKSHKTLSKYTFEVQETGEQTRFYSKTLPFNLDELTTAEVKPRVEDVIRNKQKQARHFTTRFIDFAKFQEENREVGRLGEEFVLDIEKRKLNRQQSLNTEIEHTSKKRGDGAGYDIAVFHSTGNYKFIEVKTTKNELKTPFYMSINEYEFFLQHKEHYILVRVYNFNPATKTGSYEYFDGSVIEDLFDFEINAYKVKFR